MKTNRRSYFGALVAAAFLCAAPALFAQSADMNFPLDGAGSNIYGGVYIGPYMIEIDGITVYAICDDFASDTYPGESWTAYVTNYNEDLSNTKWGDQSLYNRAAWLSMQLLDPSTTAAQAGSIQFAIWQLFSDTPFQHLLAWEGAGAVASAQAYLDASVAYANTSFDYFSIYTPVPGGAVTCGGGPCLSSPPQEFLVVKAPEAATVALLAVDLSVLGLLFVAFRRRSERNAMKEVSL